MRKDEMYRSFICYFLYDLHLDNINYVTKLTSSFTRRKVCVYQKQYITIKLETYRLRNYENKLRISSMSIKVAAVIENI